MASYGVRVATALAQAALATVIGTLIYTLWNMHSILLGREFLLWFALVMGTTMPVAFAGVGLAGLLSISGQRRAPVASLVCLTGVAASIYLFECYMTALSPATNWSGAALLPTTSFISGFALALLRWPRFEQHKKGIVPGSA